MRSAKTAYSGAAQNFASGCALLLLTTSFVTYFIPRQLHTAQISSDNDPEDNGQSSEPIRAPLPNLCPQNLSKMTRAMVLRFQCVAHFPTHCIVVPVEMDNWGGIAFLRECE